MRASRLLSILITLQAQGQRSAASLAEELEVSVRTIYRDVDALSAAGVPIYAERGAGGGFRLLDGYKTRLTGMTRPEAEAMLFMGLPGPAMQLGLADAYFASRLKLLASLPQGMREEATRIASRFHLDTAAWNPDEASIYLLPDLAGAVWDQRRIRLDYESWTKASARLVDPLGLVLKAGTWYLVARDGGRVLTYRLASIRAVAITDETFERDAQFDLAAHWRSAQEEFVARLQQDWAVVRVRADLAERLRLISAAVAQNLETLGPDPVDPDWVRARLPIEGLPHATREMLKFGPDLEVLEPAALRSALARAATAMAIIYRA